VTAAESKAAKADKKVRPIAPIQCCQNRASVSRTTFSDVTLAVGAGSSSTPGGRGGAPGTGR
jgi:hypothetical protein